MSRTPEIVDEYQRTEVVSNGYFDRRESVYGVLIGFNNGLYLYSSLK